MPVYEEKEKVNGQKRYYIRTYVADGNGNKKQITRHNKEWIGRDGYWLAHQTESDLKNKCEYNVSKLTLFELHTAYLDYCSNVRNLKLSTLTKIRDTYRLYLEPFFAGNRLISEISPKEILEWHEWLIRTKHLANLFNRNIHTTFVTMLNFACKFHGLEKNVASSCGNFESKKGLSKKEMNFLTVEEFKQYIINEKSEIYKCFFTILFYTGMRLGELWCLTWDDVNYEKKEILINKAYNPRNKDITTPKTSKSNRTIKMLCIVEENLKIMEKYKTDNFVFGTNKITGTTLRRKNKNNYKQISQSKRFRIHDFRHSFASLCIDNEVPIGIVSEYLGHENISTTLDIYGHLYPNAQCKLISILERKHVRIS